VTGTERGEQREFLGVLGAGSGGVDHDPQIAARDAQDAGDGVDVRAGRRQPPVHHRARADPGAAPVRSGAATHSTDAGAGRQGLLGPAPTGPTCAGAASRRPFRSRSTSRPIGGKRLRRWTTANVRPDRYRQRHAVECGINLHKQHRGFATRYDKLAVRYEDAAEISDIDIWLRDLSNRA
jgi:hypothetical protein